MSICIAIAVPDGIALAADSQTTWNQTITQARQRGSNQLFDLAQPMTIPIGWSKMTRKLFNIRMNRQNYAICFAGTALLNQKTIYSIFKTLEKIYDGNGEFDHVAGFCVDGLKTELKKHLNVPSLEQAPSGTVIEFILSGYTDNDVSKPRVESWVIFSGVLNVDGVGQFRNGDTRKWTNFQNGKHLFGGCWIGRSEFVSHVVNHQNPQMPPIQGQFEFFSLADAVDYTKFLVDFTCDYQRFATMVPDCGKPIISATLTPDEYEEVIIK